MRSLLSKLGMVLATMLMLTAPVMAVGPPDEHQVQLVNFDMIQMNDIVNEQLGTADLILVSENIYMDFDSGADLIRQDALEVAQPFYSTRSMHLRNAPRHRLSRTYQVGS